MYYFDYLRVRRALSIYGCVLLACLAITLVSLPFSFAGNHHFSVGLSSEGFARHRFDGIALLHELGKSQNFPFGGFAVVAGMLTTLFMMGSATSLGRFNGNLHFSFTRPVSRERETLTTVGFDALAIAFAFAFTVVVLIVPFAVVGLLDRIRFDPSDLAVIALGLGVTYMWYAMLQAATARLSRGGLVVGLSWGLFAIVHALEGLTVDQIPPLGVWAIRALNVINPFTYLHFELDLGDLSRSGAVSIGSALFEHIAIVYVVAFAALGIAVVSRQRMEV